MAWQGFAKLAGACKPGAMDQKSSAHIEEKDTQKVTEIQVLRHRLKRKYGYTLFSGQPVFQASVRGPSGEDWLRLKPDPRVYRHREFALRGERKEAIEISYRNSSTEACPSRVTPKGPQPASASAAPRRWLGSGGSWSAT